MKLRNVRRISQVFFFSLFLFFVVVTDLRYLKGYPVSLFLELVEEMHITVIVASHAWQHIKRLQLRRLSHHTQRSGDGSVTETVVKG